MAIPAFINGGALSQSASATTLSPALPASRVNGRVLISWVTVNATGKTFSVASGWATPTTINTGSQSASWTWIIIDGTEVSPAWSWTGAAACTSAVFQFSGNTTPTPVGISNSATADASVTETIASITASADNSLLLGLLFASTNQTIPLPTDYTNIASNATANGSSRYCTGALTFSGSSSEAISVTITSANWTSFGIEILGTGTGTDNERSSQVVQSILESYSDATTMRTSQVVEAVLENYSDPTEMRTSQVVLAVLRSVGVDTSVTPIAYLTNCDTDVNYPGGSTWSSRTVRVDQASGRPLAHWKRGLDVDRWTLTLMPRPIDPVTQEVYPDKINGVPWISAARSGALDGCEVEIFRAYFPKWPDYAPVITPTGIYSIFAGRIAEADVTDLTVVLTINDFRELLTTTIPVDVYSSQCRHTLFDFGCTLTRSTFAKNGVVGTGSTQSQIVSSTDLATQLATLGDGTLTYALGTIVFTSGLNDGFSRTITTWTPPSTVALVNPLPYEIAVGDTFTIYPGCNKTQAACTSFNNIQNFGGQPYIPTVASALG